MLKPLILVANDDGIDSPSLDLLVVAVLGLGEVVVVAPATEQSSMGRAFPRTNATGIITRRDKKIAGIEVESYSVTGSPTMAVDHAIEEILARRPDICLTGINPGENIGSTMMCSGTIMAAIEASSYNLPAIAFSMEDKKCGNPETVKYWCHKIAHKVILEGLPQQVPGLNVNFPSGVQESTQVDLTRLSHQNYYEFIPPKKRDFSLSQNLMVEKKYDLAKLEKDSDIFSLIISKHISITPVTWDFTARVNLEELSEKYHI